MNAHEVRVTPLKHPEQAVTVEVDADSVEEALGNALFHVKQPPGSKASPACARCGAPLVRSTGVIGTWLGGSRVHPLR